MKKIITSIICIMLILAFSASAVFADFYVVDPFNGDVLSGSYDDNSAIEDVGVVSVSSSCNYEKASGKYVYTVSDNKLLSNVCSGQYTQNEVYISANADAGFILYHNDERTPIEGDIDISKPGKYLVRDKLDKMLMEFTVLSKINNDIYSYQVPAVYRVAAFTLNGDNIAFSSNSVDFDEEGQYEVSLYNKITGKTETLYFLVDRTAPELDLIGVTEGEAWQAVSFGDLEEDSSITVYRDGVQIDLADAYETAGDYKVMYTDAAGNTSEISFTIHLFLDVNAWFAVGFIVALIVAALSYMFYWRKHTRVG